MILEKYKSYTTEDFVSDDYFLKLAKGKIIDGFTLDDFKKSLPEKIAEIELAAEIISSIRSPRVNYPKNKKDQILQQIFNKSRSLSIQTWMKRSVAAILIIGFATAYLFYREQQNSIVDFALSNQVKSKNTELILNNGHRVEIADKQAKLKYAADGSSLSLNDSSKLEQEKPQKTESFNQAVVPYGKRLVIHLADGSIVRLNSGSRMIYPPSFDKQYREVYLEGEAYFEVSKDKTRPFYVRTEEFKIKVLGTKFAVQAFKKDNEYNTLLVEGSVSLSNNKLFSQEQILKPSQKATLSKSGNEFKITEVKDIESQISWIYGYLIFKDENLESLSEKVSRYYNIDIEVFTTNKTSLFSGKLDIKDDPKRVIEGLSTIFNVKYENQNGVIVFKD